MTFLTKSLPRRTVLQGMGAAIALPFLEAMLPALRGKRQASHAFLYWEFHERGSKQAVHGGEPGTAASRQALT